MDRNAPQSECVCARLPLALPDEVAAFSLTQQLVGLFPGNHPVVPGWESSKNQPRKPVYQDLITMKLKAHLLSSIVFRSVVHLQKEKK